LLACVTPKLVFSGELILFTFQEDSKLLLICPFGVVPNPPGSSLSCPPKPKKLLELSASDEIKKSLPLLFVA
jgi:hypothetical protein